MVRAIEAAVRFYEEPPTKPMTIDHALVRGAARAPPTGPKRSRPPAPGSPHNDAREQVWDELLTILIDKHDVDIDDGEATPDEIRRSLQRNGELRSSFNRAWPLLDATDVVADLWSVPAYLRRCAPGLRPEEIARVATGRCAGLDGR